MILKRKISLNAGIMTTIFILFIMFILFGFNTFNVDMKQYESIFQIYQNGYTYSSDEFEIGFKMIFKLCYFLGISYQEFLISIAFIGLFFIYKTANKLSDRPNIVLILFFLFPFFHQVTIIRNFIALAISFYGLQYIDKKEPLKYILFIFIATLFHTSALINILFLGCFLTDKKLNITILCCMIFMLSILYIPSLKFLLISLIPKMEAYLFDQTRISTKLILVLYYFSVLLLSRKLIITNGINDREAISHVMYKCLKIGIVFLPLTFLSMNFFRLIENIILCFYIIIANSIFKRPKKYKTKISINSIYVIMLIFLQYFIFEIYFSYESVILPIIKNNLLW